MQWTSSDNLRAREALVVGGELDGLRVAVRELSEGEGRQEHLPGSFKYPDVLDLRAYDFDAGSWTFRLKEVVGCG